MPDYNKELKQLQGIEKHLKQFGMIVKYKDTSPDKSGERKPLILTWYEYKGRKFDILVSAQLVEGEPERINEWLKISVLVYDLSGHSDEKINKIYRICLELNAFFPETTLSGVENYIYVEADMLPDISYKDFQYEMNGLLNGIDNFVIRMKTELGLEVNLTKGKLK